MSWQICVAAVVLSAASFGQSAITEPKLIAYAKGLDVSRLDPTLPKQPLEKWFSAQGIAEDKRLWRRSDCDLMPNVDKPKEPRPLCVDFVISVASKAGIIGKIFVGTDQKGIDGPPKFGGMHMMKGRAADGAADGGPALRMTRSALPCVPSGAGAPSDYSDRNAACGSTRVADRDGR